MSPTISTSKKSAAKSTGQQTNNSLSSIAGHVVIESSSTVKSNDSEQAASCSKISSSSVLTETEEILKIGLHKVLEQVKNHKDAWPVKEDIAPRYYSIIRRPMDLQQMEERLENGQYQTFTDFRNDFELIVNNCLLYNGQNDEYNEMVNNLQHEFENATKEYFDQNSSDKDADVEYLDQKTNVFHEKSNSTKSSINPKIEEIIETKGLPLKSDGRKAVANEAASERPVEKCDHKQMLEDKQKSESKRNTAPAVAATVHSKDEEIVREDGNAVVSHQNQSAKIFKLTIDCIEDVFDYLSESDLLKVAKTCKLLQQVVGYIYKQYFPRFLNVCLVEGIREPFSTDFLAEFVEYFSLESESDYKYLLEIQPRLRGIKQIDFISFEITASKLVRMVDILKNVENLFILESSFNGNLYDDVLAYCPNLKTLVIRDVDELKENENIGSDWTLQNYPKLEYFSWSAEKMPDLTNFLHLNPNIRTVATSVGDLWANRDMMMTAEFSLNVMRINIWEHDFTVLFAHLLQKLHTRGVYKHLKLLFNQSLDASSHETIGLLASLNVPIVCLEIGEIAEDLVEFQLSDLIHLEEIQIEKTNRVTNIEAMANNLTKLKRIIFKYVSFNDILPFISRAANLRKICIFHLKEGIHFDATTKIINLPALKKMREKLTAAKNVILYVDENIYLINKWTHRTTDFGIIRIMREASRDWPDFIWE